MNTHSAIVREERMAASSPVSPDIDRCTSSASAPAMGSSNSAGRIQPLNPIESRNAVTCVGSPEGEDAEYADRAKHEHPGVRTHAALLDLRADPADAAREERA